MPEYKLVYFNAKGRAELTRWILAYGGTAYTDERVELENWPERKKTIMTGKVPMLEIDGKQLPQSLAIARYVAKKAGLVPEDALRAAYCDALVDTVSDLITEGHKAKTSGKSEEDGKKAVREEFIPNHAEPVMERLNKHLGEKEWYTSGKITWADLSIASYFGEETNGFSSKLLDKYPALKAHIQKVRNLPKIKEWLAKRPVTSM
ncbi:Hematopoietic prostaglandin D synthase-like 1 [Homarus americanus]|uniref:glutathione transferase n=2 Tax=Homarus americanus TaxID=6706 RepID=A0A8J5KFE9_HOMAM|nr:Hematopoietic prostaglandin D synthase-like 1 [Homarus americanus]